MILCAVLQQKRTRLTRCYTIYIIK